MYVIQHIAITAFLQKSNTLQSWKRNLSLSKYGYVKYSWTLDSPETYLAAFDKMSIN